MVSTQIDGTAQRLIAKDVRVDEVAAHVIEVIEDLESGLYEEWSALEQDSCLMISPYLLVTDT